MTRIDFYSGSTDRLRTACLLSNKAMQNNVRVVLSSDDVAHLSALEKLLWQYPPTGFIPHCRSDADDAAHTPVVLHHGGSNLPHHELLISLHRESPAFFSRFERVIEIVSQDSEDSRMARERYKFYLDRGYEITHVDLNESRAS
ncbi:MAG: DNA polymerase III subunit chi [Pseudomonadota bacterium]